MKNPLAPRELRGNTSRQWIWISLGVPIVAAAAAMSPALGAQYVLWDDADFMAQSPFGRQGTLKSLWLILSGKAYPLNSAYPVFQASWFLDVLVFRRNPHLSHLLNLVLHLVNVALVWQCIRVLMVRALGARSTTAPDRQVLLAAALGAAVFGVHPINVEPVAWVSGRKVELAFLFSTSAFLLLLSPRGGWLRYGLAILCYGLALLSNATALGLSLVFGAWWAMVQGVRFPKALVLASPFLLLSLWSATTRSALDKVQWERADNPEISNRTAPLGAHLSARARETLDLVWPRGLVPVYPVAKPPFWTPGSFVGIVLIAGSAWLIVWGWIRGRADTAASERSGRSGQSGRGGRSGQSGRQDTAESSPTTQSGPLPTAYCPLPTILAFGLAWYWLALGPAFLHHRIQADRHLYISTAGLFMAFGVLSARMFGRLRAPAKRTAMVAYCAAGLALSIVAARQAAHWRTSKSLFQHTVAVAQNNPSAHMNLGIALAQEGDFDGAIQRFRASLDLIPDQAQAHHNLGLAFLGKGEIDRAIEELSIAVKIKPAFAEAQSRLGAALVEAKRWAEAIPHCEAALRANPESAETQHNLGIALGATGHPREALARCEAALHLKPDYAEAEATLGNVLVKLDRAQDAIVHFERALRLKPDYAQAENGLGSALVLLGRSQEAVAHYEAALRLDPGNALVENNLANVLSGLGRTEEAAAHRNAASRFRTPPAGGVGEGD